MRLSMQRFPTLLLLAALPLWAACDDDDDNGTGPTPSIEISAAPGVVTIAQGEDGAVTVTLTRSGGFDGPVDLAASDLPEGVTATSPTIASGETQADVTFSAAADAAVGTGTVTIEATGTGVTSATTEVDVEVTETATPGFGLTFDPTAVSINQGGTGSATIQIARTGGFEGAVDLAVSGEPAGLTATLGSESVEGDETTLDLEAAADLATDTYTLTLTGSGADVDDVTAEIDVTVNAGTFELALDPTSLSVEQGTSESTTVQIDRTGGFTGTVDLEVTGAPTGLTTTLGSASVTDDETTLEIEAAGDLTPDTYTLTVTGSGEGTEERTVELDVTVTEAGGGGGVQASWTFCTDVPDWFAVRDGTSGDWMQVEVTNGNTFEFEVSSDVAGVAYVQDGQVGSDLNVHLLGVDEIPTVGASFCAEAGPRTVDVTVEDLGADQMASLVLGSSVATILGAAGNTGTFEQVPEGTVDLFGARADVDQTTGAQMVDRLYLERGLDPADGSSVTVDFAGANSFDPQSATATIQNLNGELASLSLGYMTPDMSSFLGVASFGELSDSETRDLPLVPAAQQEGDDLHTLFLSAVPDLQDPDRSRMVISFFAGTDDQQIELGPDVSEPTITTAATTPYAQPRVEAMTQAEYDRYWLTTFDQDMATANLFVTDEYQEGDDLDVTFPDLSSAAGWDNAWGLQTGETTDVSFTAFGWDAPGGLIPSDFTDGMRIRSATWTGEIIP